MFCFASDFLAQTQSLSVHDPRFEQLMITSLDDFVVGERCAAAVFHQSSQEIPVPWFSSTVLGFPICSSQQLRCGCPETVFHFQLDRSSATLMSLFPVRIADLLGLRHTKSGRL